MEIIMHRSSLCFPLFFCFTALTAHAAASDPGSSSPSSATAIVREMNVARTNPALYATYAEELRSRFDGRCLVLPGHGRIVTKEGSHAIDEAIHFLKTTRPLQPLTLSPGMCKGAADHCLDQAAGGFSHSGRDGSNPASRMNRYGNWGGGWGENIAYGKQSARDVVLTLIIDDGQRGRKHRKNIFNPGFNYAGAALGPHSRFGSVCTTDFAGSYSEQGQTAALVAANYSDR
jgi:uncharacterized protein YkwD